MTALLPLKLNPIRVLLAGVLLAATLAAGMARADQAEAARGMEVALQDDPVFVTQNYFDRERGFQYARALGVTRLKINVSWAFSVAPSQRNDRTKPANVTFAWGTIDDAIDAAARNGIRVHVALTGPAPAWATGNRRLGPNRPNSKLYAEFVRAAAEHFKGRVDRYSIWNEPNWHSWLNPLRSSPALYRALYLAGYTEIKRVDPSARVLIGETVPFARRGLSTAPLAWLRRMLCVNKNYRRKGRCTPLRADGYAHHPYEFKNAPTFQYPGKDNVTIGTLSRLTRGLRRLRRAGVLRGARSIHLTEFGYFARGRRALSVRKRTRYLQKGFSIALKNRAVKTQLQYLLVSPPKRFAFSFFDLGLVSTTGRRYPQYKALRSWYRRNKRKVKRPGKAITLPPRPSG